MSKVYEAIRAVTLAMSADGISKTRKNTQQGYNFRGIDEVLNALSGPLCDAGLTILPRVTERAVVERETKNGGALFNVTVKVEFDFIAVEDGSKHTVVTYGEAMDSADKATNKAMSAAFKYMALLAFCIPTEPSADTDADATTHDVRGKSAQFAPPPPPRQPPPAPPTLIDQGTLDMMLAAVKAAPTAAALRQHFNAGFVTATEAKDAEAIKLLTAAKDARKKALASAPAAEQVAA